MAADFDPSSTGNPLNLRNYTSTLSAAGTNDNASFALAAPAPVVSDMDLHIPPGTMTQLAHGAAPGTGVIDDIDGNARNPVAPDIGADEFSGQVSPTPTPTATATSTPTAVSTGTVAATPTATATFTPTPTATATFTPTPTPTPGMCQYAISQIVTEIPRATTDIGNHGDDVVTTIALPFPFTLYDQTFTSVNLSSNGNAGFVKTAAQRLPNTCLPTTTLG